MRVGDQRRARLAQHRAEIGLRRLAAEPENYFKSNLERLTGGAKDKAIVFFCLRDCWMSWNAAKRAIAWGYTDVVWFPDGTSENPEIVLLADVDEARARPVLEAVINANATGPVTTLEVAGVQVTTVADVSGDPLAYAFKDGYLAIGTPGAIEAVLSRAPGDSSLAGSPRYSATVEQMPSALGTYAFFDLAALLRLEEAPGVPAVLDRAEQALDGLIINAVEERGVVRYSGVLTIGE